MIGTDVSHYRLDLLNVATNLAGLIDGHMNQRSSSTTGHPTRQLHHSERPSSLYSIYKSTFEHGSSLVES
jgi:hypothetical protein